MSQPSGCNNAVPKPPTSIHTVYVLSQEGSPLMPTRPAKAKWLLKQGKAKVVARSPFTIRLTYPVEAPVCQPLSLAIDDGETVGVAVIQTNQTHQRVVCAAQMRLRGREIHDLLSQRCRLRRARRRRRWQRPPKRHDTTPTLPPSIRADIDAKIRLIQQLFAILPISTLLWEPLSFSIEDQKRSATDGHAPRLLPPYLKGSPQQPKPATRLGQKQRERLLARDEKRCCVCSRMVTEETAFFYRISSAKKVGSFITLCRGCSEQLTRDRCVLSFDPEKYADARGAKRVMHGKGEFGRRLKALSLPIFRVNGWRTAQCRKRMNLPKSHIHDAVAIGCKGEPCWLLDSAFVVRLRARHQRKLFFENPGDRAIQYLHREKGRSARRRARRQCYQKRYGAGGVRSKQERLGYRCEPFAPYEAIYVTNCGQRGFIKNRKIHPTQVLPAPKDIATIFRRGDLVTTAEGRLAFVVTLFSTGKVGIRFCDSPPSAESARTARIPETLTMVARSKPMQFIRVPLSPNDAG